MANRILHPSLIPDNLWSRVKSVLKFPECLRNSYHNVLTSEGLFDEAMEAVAQGDIGGESTQETVQHFARNFSGSCGRLQLATLDPNDDLEEASNLFMRTFAGGRIGLLDIPCGAGAATAAVLSTIVSLREKHVIPREPLDVFLIAGDFSTPARETATKLFQSLAPEWEKQAVFLHFKMVEWNVLESSSTINLLHTWMEHARDCREYFVLAANFSGFLKYGGNFNKALPQLQQVFGWAAQRRSSVIWLEPCNNGAKQGFWKNFKEKLWNYLTSFNSHSGKPAPDPLESHAKIKHPLKPDFSHRVNLTLVRLERNES